MWDGEDIDIALENSLLAGLRVGGVTFLASVLASQFLKAGLNSSLVSVTDYAVRALGPKASSFIANVFRDGKNLSGGAAYNSASKLLRGNMVTGAITVVLLSIGDVADLFSGRISGAQLFKNVATTTVSVAGGTGGAMVGATIGSMILPGAGTLLGGLLGGLFGGQAGQKVTSGVLDCFIEDDAKEMVDIIQKEFQSLAFDYLLNEEEGKKCVERLAQKLNGDTLKDMYETSSRHTFARNLLSPIMDHVTKERTRVVLPSERQVNKALRNLINKMEDTASSTGSSTESNSDGYIVRAEFPGLIFGILKGVRSVVKKGETIINIEYIIRNYPIMRRRYAIKAPGNGVITSISVCSGESVSKGKELFKIN